MAEHFYVYFCIILCTKRQLSHTEEDSFLIECHFFVCKHCIPMSNLITQKQITLRLINIENGVCAKMSKSGQMYTPYGHFRGGGEYLSSSIYICFPNT